MLLSEFKSVNGISNLDMYPSKVEGSTRFVGSYPTSNGKEQKVVTVAQFDNTKPVFVYSVDVTDEETGEITHLKMLSNKEPKEPAFKL